MRIGIVASLAVAGLAVAGLALASSPAEESAPSVAGPATAAAEPAAATPEAPAAPVDAGPTDAAPAPSPEDQARRAKLLAKVGDRVLTVGDFEDQLSSDSIPPPVRAGYADPERVKQEFDERVERMAVAAWAMRQGLDRRADIRREVRKLYRGITLYRQIQQSVSEQTISDTDIAAYYEAHSDLYNRPETVNGGLILLADRPGADAALQRALAAKGNRAELTKIVRELSADGETKRRGGSLGYFDRDGRLNRVLGAGQPEPPRVDAAIVAAAFTLTNPFDVYPQVVDTARGPGVVFILNRTPAVSRGLEEVGPRIRLELVNQRRDQMRDQYVSEARARYAVQVVDANFEHVVVAPSPPETFGPRGLDPLEGPSGMGGGPARPPMPMLPPAPSPGP